MLNVPIGLAGLVSMPQELKRPQSCCKSGDPTDAQEPAVRPYVRPFGGPEGRRRSTTAQPTIRHSRYPQKAARAARDRIRSAHARNNAAARRRSRSAARCAQQNGTRARPHKSCGGAARAPCATCLDDESDRTGHGRRRRRGALRRRRASDPPALGEK